MALLQELRRAEPRCSYAARRKRAVPRANHELLSIMTGNALFSARLSTSAKLSIYGELMTQYKHEHKATVVAVSDSALGYGFSFNAPASKQVGPDQVIYCIAERRIVQADMSGGQPVPATTLAAGCPPSDSRDF